MSDRYSQCAYLERINSEKFKRLARCKSACSTQCYSGHESGAQECNPRSSQHPYCRRVFEHYLVTASRFQSSQNRCFEKPILGERPCEGALYAPTTGRLMPESCMLRNEFFNKKVDKHLHFWDEIFRLLIKQKNAHIGILVNTQGSICQ